MGDTPGPKGLFTLIFTGVVPRWNSSRSITQTNIFTLNPFIGTCIFKDRHSQVSLILADRFVAGESGGQI